MPTPSSATRTCARAPSGARSTRTSRRPPPASSSASRAFEIRFTSAWRSARALPYAPGTSRSMTRANRSPTPSSRARDAATARRTTGSARNAACSPPPVISCWNVSRVSWMRATWSVAIDQTSSVVTDAPSSRATSRRAASSAMSGWRSSWTRPGPRRSRSSVSDPGGRFDGSFIVASRRPRHPCSRGIALGLTHRERPRTTPARA